MSVNIFYYEKNSYFEFFVVSKCDQDRTERNIAVVVAIVVVEIEHASIRAIVVIASADEERIARVRKVRVIVLSLLYYTKYYVLIARF